jgi:CheY-like chemotaxis protein
MDERILIVEDDQDTRYLFAQILRSSGYVPVTVGSGEEALERGLGEAPDLVLLDIGLPGIDGWETLRRLREEPLTARVPVVIVSARDGLENLLRAYSSGVSYYAVKPCKKQELLRGIRLALGQGSLAGATTQGSSPSGKPARSSGRR